MYSDRPVRRQISSDNVTKEQAQRLHDRIAPTMQYLHRLQDEMVTQRFRSDDPLFKLTQGAYSALFKLSVEARRIMRGDQRRRPR